MLILKQNNFRYEGIDTCLKSKYPLHQFLFMFYFLYTINVVLHI
jgi:hypothetical protein